MKFMVQFRLRPGTRNAVIASFENRGPNRNPGVRFHGAWVGTRSDLIFAVGESEDEPLLRQACLAWDDVEDCEIYPVVEIEQF